MSFDDDELTLSASALAALLEFKKEEEARKEEFARLKQVAQDKFDAQQELLAKKGMGLFQEDWQLSQFWYADSTADTLADELLDGADEDTVICVVSAPSVYAAIKKRDPSRLPTEKIYLFEYDRRFEVIAGDNFGFYDYHEPLNFRDDLKGKVDRLLIDPPFIEQDCQKLTSDTAHSLMSKDRTSKTKTGVLKHRLITCTGERVKELLMSVYPGLQPTTFFPEHANGLSNEFYCYADYEGNKWKFLKD